MLEKEDKTQTKRRAINRRGSNKKLTLKNKLIE